MSNFDKSNSAEGKKGSHHFGNIMKHKGKLELPSILSAQNGRTSELIVPLVILLIFAFIFVIVLPRLSFFSHVIEVDQDAASITAGYMDVGDESIRVTELQKNLYKLNSLAFENITGRFDDTTLKALNNVLAANGKEPAEGCSNECFDFVAGLVLGGNGSTNAGDVGADVTTTTTTAAPVIKQIKVTAASTKLRQHARENSLPLFLLIKDDTYDYIEQSTDAGGNLWYKVVYSPECNGWVNAKDAECIYG